MKKLSIYLAASLFITLFPASAHSEENIVMSALKSDFAVKVYAGVCIGTGIYATKTLIDPLLAKYRQLTGTENLNELHNKVMLREKWIELDETEYKLQLAKITALRDFLPTYETIMNKKINEINQASNEQEKAKKIEALQSRMKQTQDKLDEKNIENFEHLVNQVSSRLHQKHS